MSQASWASGAKEGGDDDIKSERYAVKEPKETFKQWKTTFAT